MTDYHTDEFTIHFGHEDSSTPRLLCEACGEPVRITGERTLQGFEPVGCGCDERGDYRLEHIGDTDD